MSFLSACARYLKHAEGEAVTSFETLNTLILSRHPRTSRPLGKRVPIRPQSLDVRLKKNLRRRIKDKARSLRQGWEPHWIRKIDHRRAVLLLLAMLTAGGMAAIGYSSLFTELEGGLNQYFYFTLYIGLNCYGSYAFYKTLYGAILALRGPMSNPCHPGHKKKQPEPGERCAILFPVYHEDMTRVGAGMAALIEDFLQAHPDEFHRYDIFLLSDSRKTATILHEQAVLYHLQDRYPQARLYYRHRPGNINAKLGNVTDFFRRWGSDYTYIYPMDADSVVMADCIHQSLCMMSGNPRIGIIQTNPLPIFRQSLFGRMVQFSSHINGVLFAYSLQALSIGHANYLGHNAIIRLKPFIEHCILPELPGQKPWGGKPLSHDIAESAMMGRAGYEVWFLPELRGSYEEIPANISGFLERENRWMQGNIQNTRLLFTKDSKSLYNEAILIGAVGYLLSPVSIFFALTSALASFNVLHLRAHIELDIEYSRDAVILLFIISITFVILPRILSILLAVFSKSSARYGGFMKMMTSMMLETLFSMVFNSIVMFYICTFILSYIRQKPFHWDAQQRSDAPLPLRQTLKTYLPSSLIGAGALWGIQFAIANTAEDGVQLLDALTDGLDSPESMLFWFTPLLGGMILSPLIVYLSSKTYPALRKLRLFCIPEELNTPFIMTSLLKNQTALAKSIPDDDEALLHHALSSPQFYVRHFRAIRDQGPIARRLLPRIISGATLSPQEITLALRDRRCFTALCARYNNIPHSASL